MASSIRLVIADVDGTLVTQEKVVTPRAIAAVNRLREAGIAHDVLEPVSIEAATNSTVRANPKAVTESQILQLLQGAW